MTPAQEHAKGLHERGLASPDCIMCARFGWLDVGFDDTSLIDPEVRAAVHQSRAKAKLCRLCKGELKPDRTHLHADDLGLHDEMVSHSDHVKRGEYPVHRCSFCAELYDRAYDNHREHAGTRVHHSVAECISSYRRYAEGMSAS